MLLFVSILILAPYHHFSLSQPLDKKALPIEIDVNDLTNEYSILDIYSLLAEKFSKEVIDDMVDDSVNSYFFEVLYTGGKVQLDCQFNEVRSALVIREGARRAVYFYGTGQVEKC